MLGLSLGVSPMATAGSSPSSLLTMRSAPEGAQTPEEFYAEGKRAYRLGRFDEAVEKWEKSYDLSERSLLLYNIALAYKGRFGISGDVEDLRKARAVMKNFLIIAEADPDVEADDAPERIAELDQMITDAEASDGGDEGGGGDLPPPDPPRPLGPEGPDPGRTLRIAGAASLGTGGLLVVTGAVLGIYFGVRGQEFSDNLRQLQVERPEICVVPDSTTCLQQDVDIENARANGRSANLGVGLALGIGGGLGIVVVGAGAILFVQGNRRTADWKLVPNGRGVALQGRF